jgi:glutathione S-transferase
MIKLYAMPISQPARAVIWLLECKSVSYKLINTMPGGRGSNGTKHASYLKKFPMGTVPSLSYGDDIYISESHAIMSFLADKYGWDDFYPKNLASRSRINAYLHWHHRNTREITIGLFAPTMRPDIKFSESQIKLSTKAVSKVLNYIETLLNVRSWLCTSSSPRYCYFFFLVL